MKKNLIIFGLLIVTGYCCAQPSGDNPQSIVPHFHYRTIEFIDVNDAKPAKSDATTIRETETAGHNTTDTMQPS